MPHEYHELLPEIFMGSAADVQDAVDREGIDVVVDLRHEAKHCAAEAKGLKWIKVPLGDNSPVAEAALFKQAIDEVVAAHRDGKKVMFHCGLGRGRTGTVAAGVLLEMGLASSVEDAASKAKLVRPEISIQPVQAQALHQIFG